MVAIIYSMHLFFKCVLLIWILLIPVYMLSSLFCLMPLLFRKKNHFRYLNCCSLPNLKKKILFFFCLFFCYFIFCSVPLKVSKRTLLINRRDTILMILICVDMYMITFIVFTIIVKYLYTYSV